MSLVEPDDELGAPPAAPGAAPCAAVRRSRQRQHGRRRARADAAGAARRRAACSTRASRPTRSISWRAAASACSAHDDDDAAEGPTLIAEITPGNIVGEMSLLSHSHAHAQRRGVARQRGLAAVAGELRALTGHHPEVLPALMRNVARAQRHGPGQAPAASRAPSPCCRPGRTCRRHASRCCSSGARPDRRSGPDAGPGIRCTRSRNGSRAARWIAPSCSIAPMPALTPWTELCLRQADCLVVVRNADDDLPTKLPFEIEAAQPGARVPSPPRAGAAARGPRSQARFDRAAARRRHVRPASPCPARPAVRFRPAGAADHRPCGGRGHGRRRRARLHPYRRGQGAARHRACRSTRSAAPAWARSSPRPSRRAGPTRSWPSASAAPSSPPIRSATTPCRSSRCSAAAGSRAAAHGVRRQGHRGPDPALLSASPPTSRPPSADTHTAGKLWRWLRASVSLPGVLPPFNDAGQVHVDGGVIDNLPVRVMRRRAAASPSPSISTPAARWPRAPTSRSRGRRGSSSAAWSGSARRRCRSPRSCASCCARRWSRVPRARTRTAPRPTC